MHPRMETESPAAAYPPRDRPRPPTPNEQPTSPEAGTRTSHARLRRRRSPSATSGHYRGANASTPETRRDSLASFLKSLCTKSPRLLYFLSFGGNFCFFRGFFPKKNVSCPKVSQPNIHNIPIDHWRLSLSFCFLLQIEPSFYSHGQAWVHATIIVTCRHDTCACVEIPLQFPYREKE